MKGKGRYGQYIRWIFSGVDFLILNTVYLIVCHWGNPTEGFLSKQVWLMMNFSFLAVSYFFSDIHYRRVVYADKVVLQALKAGALHAVIFLSLVFFLGLDNESWTLFAKFYTLFFMGIVGWWIVSRKVIKLYRSKGYNYKRIVIVGGGVVASRLINELESDQGYGFRIMGVFGDTERDSKSPYYRGTLSVLEDYVHTNPIDEMYCCMPDGDDGAVKKMIYLAESNAVDFFYVPQFGNYITRRFELNSMGNVPVLTVRPYPLSSPLNALLKRTFDFTFSSVMLVLSPIVLIPVAIGIKMSSPGPVFFKQKRTGLRGEAFNCYKFRTMRVNNDSDTKQATKDDNRKTRFGSFLRKTSIDELPQFFNVWKGDMSIVGPRPHMESQTKEYSELITKYMLRHIIKPGITGWAQVSGYRGETDELWKMEKRVEYDVWYTENWNFMLDLKIIFLTIVNAIRGDKNAF